MPKVISESDLASVLGTVAELFGPASIEEIAMRLPTSLPRRTLQRRLARLVEQGRLVAEGAKRGWRYRLTPVGAVTPTPGGLTGRTGPGRIPLSAEGEEIRQRVTGSISSRKPVGYRAAFLDDYQPNVSAYLPSAIRQSLADLGQITAETQPAGTYFRKILDRLLIDLSWNSSRLEGNTYSLLETQRLIEAGENTEGKAAEETQMILNHKAAIELLVEQAADIGFNRYTLCNLHALLAENLLPDPGAGGRLRARAVAITGTTFHPLEVPQTIEEHFDRLLEKAEAIEDAFEQAFFAMVHLPYLQPFDDVNKRVSRMAANIPLVKRNLCPLSFVDVPQSDYVNAIMGVYELNRVDYLRDVFVWAYERSCARYSAVRQSLGEPDTFRMKYRAQIGEVVARVVRDRMDKRAATQWIQRHATSAIPGADRARFVELAETELTSLHEGNIARYRLRPSEFAGWQQAWH